jgi:3-phosphoshikimate 1-carboxyvinyltransferase
VSSPSLLRVSRSGPLRGTCRVPGDKSISHRALLFGALCDGPVEISGLGLGGDNVSTARAMQALGVTIDLAGEQARVAGVGLRGLVASGQPIDCGNSGTSIRLLLGLLAGQPFETVLEGDASLSRRPMGRVARPLGQMGAAFDGRRDPTRPEEIYPPVRVRGGALQGIRYALPVASAQLKSALILAGLQARGPTELTEPELSRDHSERMLRHLGAPILADPGSHRVTVQPDGWDGRLRAAPLLVPGDLSSAAFLFVAAALVPGSDVTVQNVGLNPTRAGVLDALRAMGADLEVTQTGEAMGEPVGQVRVRARQLRAADITGALALRSIDEIPALAVAAAAAEGVSRFGDLRELRVKESDRIASIARELGRAGVAVTEEPAGFSIEGLGGGLGALAGGPVHADHDHRIAMSGAVLGLLAGDETVVQEEDIATSFPSFAATLAALGAPIVRSA